MCRYQEILQFLKDPTRVTFYREVSEEELEAMARKAAATHWQHGPEFRVPRKYPKVRAQ